MEQDYVMTRAEIDVIKEIFAEAVQKVHLLNSVSQLGSARSLLCCTLVVSKITQYEEKKVAANHLVGSTIVDDDYVERILTEAAATLKSNNTKSEVHKIRVEL
jgi:hypothetical protein